MPRLDLQTIHLIDIARGLKLLARQAQEDAKRQGASSSRLIFEEAVKRHLKLAEDFEAAWHAEQQVPKTPRKR